MASRQRPRWPMIVLRTPKGWTGPKEIDGKRTKTTGARIRCRWARCTRIRTTCEILEDWMKSYRPERAVRRGRPASIPNWPNWRPRATRRMSANPHANGGLLLRDLRLPDFRDYAVEVPSPGAVDGGVHPRHGQVPARRHEAQPGSAKFPRSSARTRTIPTAGRMCSRSPTARSHGGDLPGRRSPRSRWAGDGDAQRAPVPGLAGGLPADRPARFLLVLRSVHPHHRFDVQPARQVAEGVQPHPLAAADRLAELSCCRRTSGGRITTASAIRIRASSTTWSTRRPRSSASICRRTPTACFR